jgi:hypothetical protein
VNDESRQIAEKKENALAVNRRELVDSPDDSDDDKDSTYTTKTKQFR